MPNDDYVDYYDDTLEVVDPIHPRQNTTNYEMKMAEEMRDLIDRYGHWLAIRTAIPGYNCPCVVDVSEGPASNCRVCHGDGKMYVDHIVRARGYTAKPQIGSEVHAPVGMIYIHGPTFLIEPGVVTPKVADYVLELVIDYDTNEPLRPYQIRDIFKIVNVAEMRDIYGKMAFYQINAEREAWGHVE